MKQYIKPVSGFIGESASPEDLELRDLGFENRREIQDPDELEEVIHELLFDDPAINAAWQELTARIQAQIDKFKSEYSWNGQDLADLADYYYEAARDYTGDQLRGLISGNLMDLAEEGDQA